MTKTRMAALLYLALKGVPLLAAPPPAPPDAPPKTDQKQTPSPTLQRIIELNSNLSVDDPAQLPMKLHSLLDSEQQFFRGTADLFYTWCKEHCADWMAERDTWLLLHGDVHIGNLGTYRLRADGPPQVHFAVVDLDEAIEAPFQLDLLRAATSLRFLARKNKIAADEKSWQRNIEALGRRYQETLNGKVASSGDEFPVVKQLLKEARVANARRWLSEYCDGTPPRKFKPFRMKDAQVSDLMTALDKPQREEVVDALWTAWARDGGKTLPQPLRFMNLAELRQAVLDVVQWTRVDSSGSQGLRKYLILVAPVEREMASSSPDSRLPIMIELKEEPMPAMARAGLLVSPSGEPRAQAVADAYGKLLDPPHWLIGYTAMKQRGYLVRVKNAWSQELSSKSFMTSAKLLEAAEIMGSALGQAHRRALLYSRSSQTQTEALQKCLSGPLAEELTTRSAEVEKELLRQYKELRKDPVAKRHVAQAEALIKKAKKPG